MSSILPTLLNAGGSILGKLTSDDTAEKMYNSLSSLPKMPNYYNSYGNKSIRELQGVGENIKTQRTYALNELKSGLSQNRLQSASEVNAMGGSLNTRRALRSMANLSYGKALSSGISSLESSVVDQMSKLGLATSQILADKDKFSAENLKESFRMDQENQKAAIGAYYGMKQQGNDYMIQGLGNLAQTLNQNDYNEQYLSILDKKLSQGIDVSKVLSALDFNTQIPNTPTESNTGSYKYTVPTTNNTNISSSSGDSLNRLYEKIGGLESGGNLDIFAGGERNSAIPTMTVEQVMRLQANRIKNGKSSAVGYGQILHPTLKGLVDNGIISKDAIFNKDTQYKVHSHLIKQAGFDQFKAGKLTSEEFALNLSKVYAALPKDSSNLSYYHGKAGNKALIDYNSYLEILNNL